MRFDTLRRSETLRMRIALVTGTVGIGKSTTGDAVAELDGLASHIDRAPELVAIQDRGLQLPVVDATGSISKIVDAVLELLT